MLSQISDWSTEEEEEEEEEAGKSSRCTPTLSDGSIYRAALSPSRRLLVLADNQISVRYDDVCEFFLRRAGHTLRQASQY
jgi:hypothetical protein